MTKRYSRHDGDLSISSIHNHRRKVQFKSLNNFSGHWCFGQQCSEMNNFAAQISKTEMAEATGDLESSIVYEFDQEGSNRIH